MTLKVGQAVTFNARPELGRYTVVEARGKMRVPGRLRKREAYVIFALIDGTLPSERLVTEDEVTA